MSDIRKPTPEEYRSYVPEEHGGSTGNPLAKYGMGVGAAALTAMAINLKMKGTKFQPSLYLIHTRLAVQGSVLGLLTGAMLYNIYKNIQKQGNNPESAQK